VENQIELRDYLVEGRNANGEVSGNRQFLADPSDILTASQQFAILMRLVGVVPLNFEDVQGPIASHGEDQAVVGIGRRACERRSPRV
jgi:hypothetical protein